MKLNRVNRIAVTAVVGLMLLGSIGQTSITAFAAEAQSPRWEGQGDFWRVKTEDGKGYMTNTWFQDLDDSWYLLGADGYMYSGLVTDQKTGCSYLMETNHNGHFGRMLFTNGAYAINGKQVTLTFNNANPADTTYGAITSGLSELRATGVREVTKGTDGAVASEQTQAQTGQQVQNTEQTNNTGNASWDAWVNSLDAEGRAIIAEKSPEYIAALQNLDSRTWDSWIRDSKNARKTYHVDEEAARELQSVMHGFNSTATAGQNNSNISGSNNTDSGQDGSWRDRFKGETKPGVGHAPALHN